MREILLRDLIDIDLPSSMTELVVVWERGALDGVAEMLLSLYAVVNTFVSVGASARNVSSLNTMA